jgi:hypothetical protein
MPFSYASMELRVLHGFTGMVYTFSSGETVTFFEIVPWRGLEQREFPGEKRRRELPLNLWRIVCPSVNI